MILILISVGIFGIASVVCFVAWRVDRFSSSRPTPVPTKAIVMLGARVFGPDSASPALTRRAEKAAEFAEILFFSQRSLLLFSAVKSI